MTLLRERLARAVDTRTAEDTRLREYRRMADLKDHRFVMKYPEGKIWVFDIPPKTPTDTIPVALAQGWSVDDPNYRKMAEVTNVGRRVVAFHADTAFGHGQVPRNGQFNTELFRKSRMVTRMLIQRGIQKTDGVAVSDGSRTLLHSALIRPDLYRNIVLITPNLVDKVTPIHLGFRFIKQEPGQLLERGDKYIDPSVTGKTLEIVSHVLKSPARTIRELRGIATTDIYDLAAAVSNTGVKVSVLYAENDGLFSEKEMLRNFERKKAAGIPFPFFDLQKVPGGHHEETPFKQYRIKEALRLLEEMKQAGKQ